MLASNLEKLRRHHIATIGLFVAFWLFILFAIGGIEFFEISRRTRDSLVGTIFGGAIVLSLLQFTKRCPKCRANLGWQMRLGIPKHCHKCGMVLR